jgi:AcrR family transcriptional regulator
MDRLSRRERRASILRAAIKAISRRGSLATRATDVSQAARVSPGLLFSYFPTLKALREAAVDSGMRKLRIRWPRNLSRVSPEAALNSIASAFIEVFHRDRDLLRLLLFDALSDGRKAVSRFRKNLVGAARRTANLIRMWKLRGWIRDAADPCSLSWVFLSTILQNIMAEDVFGILHRRSSLDDSVHAVLVLLKKEEGSGTRPLDLRASEPALRKTSCRVATLEGRFSNGAAGSRNRSRGEIDPDPDPDPIPSQV